MGLEVEQALRRANDFELSVRIDPTLEEAPGSPRCTPSLSSLSRNEVAGIIDFSSPEGLREAIDAAMRVACALVSGTTGLTEADHSALRKASEAIPICWAPNFSVGVPILVRALRAASGILPEGWQIEIVDIHHDRKRDAPSGTALRLAETWKAGRGGRFVHGREGMVGPRATDEIGLHALRLGEVVGEHRLLLGGPGENLEAVHRVGSRSAFANGSIEALRRLLGRVPGLYEWEDLLGVA
jgi:4-hydroxy-tetrahydrodipicolinate reductase